MCCFLRGSLVGRAGEVQCFPVQCSGQNCHKLTQCFRWWWVQETCRAVSPVLQTTLTCTTPVSAAHPPLCLASELSLMGLGTATWHTWGQACQQSPPKLTSRHEGLRARADRQGSGWVPSLGMEVLWHHGWLLGLLSGNWDVSQDRWEKNRLKEGVLSGTKGGGGGVSADLKVIWVSADVES